MQVFKEIVSRVPHSQLQLFNNLLHPILINGFSTVIGNWTVNTCRIDKNGCNLTHNPISAWNVTRYKSFLVMEAGAHIITVPRLGEGLCVRFSVNPKYQTDFGAAIDAVVHKMTDSIYQFQLLGDGIALGTQSNDYQDSMITELPSPYIDPQRIHELRQIKSPNFDLSKLIRLCEELNIAYFAGSFYTVGILVRTILDHVPPIFRASKFSEVANNYPGGKSFQAAIRHLQDSARNIADISLHTHARKKEVLPTRTQIDFRNDLDLLLGEIVRLTML
jgi:hypothetical protein